MNHGNASHELMTMAAELDALEREIEELRESEAQRDRLAECIGLLFRACERAERLSPAIFQVIATALLGEDADYLCKVPLADLRGDVAAGVRNWLKEEKK